MTQLEGLFLWSAVFVLAFAFAGQLAGVVFKRDALISLSFGCAVAGLVLLTATALSRWNATGHIPVMGTYENSLLGAWSVLAGLVAVVRYFPRGRFISLVLLPVIVLILGDGITAKATLAPLEPPYQSAWLYVHVLFGWFAFGAYVLASTVGGLYLIKAGVERRGRGRRGRVHELLPTLPVLDELCLRFIIFGFITDAVKISSGAIWAHGLWGRYWGWDPIETWSLIAWLTYGINLHLRLTLGWRGKKAAWLALFSFLGVLVLFFGIGLVEGLHTQIMKP